MRPLDLLIMASVAAGLSAALFTATAPKEVMPNSSNDTRHHPRKAQGESATPPLKWTPVEISVYSAKYHGGRTASGERYDHYKGHTAATTNLGRGRWALPKGSTWEVEYRGRTITVRVNDVGSYKPRRAGVWLDLSGKAWTDLTGAKPSRFVARMRRIK